MNLDYPPDSTSFATSFFNPLTFLFAVYQVDFVFANEPYQQALFNYIFNRTNMAKQNRWVKKRDEVLGFKDKPPEEKPQLVVPLIPHPVNTTQLKKLRVPLEERQDRLIYCFHRYEPQLHLPGWMSLNLKTPSGEFIPRYIVNFTPDDTIRMSIAPLFLFDYTGSAAGEANWGKYLYTLSHSTIGFEYYVGLHSHSRFPGECACLGIPCIGTDRAHSMVNFFPQTCFDPLDIPGIRAALERLVKDEEFYMGVIKYADRAVEEANWENSLNRLLFEMRALDQVLL